MAAATSETTSTIIAKPAAPKLANSVSYPVQITTICLNGSSFLCWSQAVRLYIRDRGKIGYLSGETTVPEKTDATYATWDVENSMIMAWPVNALEEDISANYMCYFTSKELWDNINQMYSDFGNQSQFYELETKLREIQQVENTVTKYFNTLKGLWQDLDLFMDYEWKYSEDGKHYIKMVECSRIFKFVAGLNLDFDEVRGRIIGRQPLSPIGEVFSEVHREESRRSVKLGKKTIAVEIENSALATSIANIPKWIDEKNQIWCDFCNKPWHTRETCWQIHGKKQKTWSTALSEKCCC